VKPKVEEAKPAESAAPVEGSAPAQPATQSTGAQPAAPAQAAPVQIDESKVDDLVAISGKTRD
jgi:hypothetical protein